MRTGRGRTSDVDSGVDPFGWYFVALRGGSFVVDVLMCCCVDVLNDGVLTVWFVSTVLQVLNVDTTSLVLTVLLVLLVLFVLNSC
jgi:hypothetical protein